MTIVVTESDRDLARDAIFNGFANCKMAVKGAGPLKDINDIVYLCDCDHGAVAGCKARVEATALAIASARKI